MITFREKLHELLGADRGWVEQQAEQFLERAAHWPVNTQINLNELAFVVAALITEPDPHVRRVTASDALKLGDGFG